VDRAARVASDVDNAVKAMRSFSTEEVQEQASEALENIRRNSLDAIENAQKESQKFIEIAQEKGLRAAIERTNSMPSEEAKQPTFEAPFEVEEISAKATELAEKAQEQMKSIGDSIWQWGQELQATVEQQASDGPGLADLSKQAEALTENFLSWGTSITKDLQNTLEGPKRGSRQDQVPKRRSAKPNKSEELGAAPEQSQGRTAPPTRDLLGDLSDEEPTSSEGRSLDLRGTSGMIKAQETSLQMRGLLAEDSDEDEYQAPAKPMAKALAVEEEAPAEWSSSKAEPAPKAVFAPPSRENKRDLLDDLDFEVGAMAAPAVPLQEKPSSVDLLG